jgi:hypothetical protein
MLTRWSVRDEFASVLIDMFTLLWASFDQVMVHRDRESVEISLSYKTDLSVDLFWNITIPCLVTSCPRYQAAFILFLCENIFQNRAKSHPARCPYLYPASVTHSGTHQQNPATPSKRSPQLPTMGLELPQSPLYNNLNPFDNLLFIFLKTSPGTLATASLIGSILQSFICGILTVLVRRLMLSKMTSLIQLNDCPRPRDSS